MSFRLAVFATLFLAGGAFADASRLSLAFQDRIQIYDKATGLTEPSGLALDEGTGGFWIVSDGTKRLLYLSQDGFATVLTAEHEAMSDLEGVASDTLNGRLLAVSEAHNEILEIPLPLEGPILRHPLDELQGFAEIDNLFDDAKNGIEGIAVAQPSGRVFIVKERHPIVLVEISQDLSRIVSATALNRKSGFVGVGHSSHKIDASGLAFDPRRGGLWILSDTDEAVRFYDIEGRHVIRLALSWMSDGESKSVRNPEGVALSQDGNTLFVVTDDGRDSALYRFSIED